jgi:hypothetical protein
MKRSGKIAAVTALTGLLIALSLALASASGAAAERLSPAERRAQESVLRLAELPAGYVLDSSWYCGLPSKPSEEEGIYEREEHKPPTSYEAFLDRAEPSICRFPYEHLYRPRGAPGGPPVIYSFALATPSIAAATEGLAVGKELATYAIQQQGLFPVEPPPTLGEAALRFHTNLVKLPGHTHLGGTLVLWREGAIIAGVFAAGSKDAIDDEAAERYAAAQQVIVSAPRPYEESEAEDIPTFLGNPNLHVPVYWLGKEFKPGGGLGVSYFTGAYPADHLYYSLGGRKMRTSYNDSLFLDSWTPRGWEKFSRTSLGRRQWTWRCTHAESVHLAHGHAVIYASYRTGYKTCPSFAPHHFSAHVFLPGAVIAIGEPLCRYCQGDLSPSFESFRAMKALVRGLRRWKPGDAG